MEFEELVNEILREDTVAGGIGSAFGSNVGATATPFSGNNYATSPNGSDNRMVMSLYKDVLTRTGTKKKKPKKKQKR